MAGRAFLSRPLDTIFAGAAHVAVLRVLGPMPAGASGREIAKLAGVDPHSALDALAVLEEVGLVRRQAAGRAYLFALRRSHFLWTRGLKVLLAAERAYREALHDLLRRKLPREVLGAALFGSGARGEDRSGSDLDLCLVSRNQRDSEALLAGMGPLAAELERRFGRRLAPIVFSRAEWRRRLRSGDRLARAILEGGVVVAGRHLRELGRA